MIEEGLTSFVRKMINRVTQTGKINIEFTTRGSDAKFEDSFVITLYRVLLELINNSLKHAQCKNIHIALIYGKKVRMIYTDDGLGFDFDKQIALGKGIGLKSILNRIELYQGNYKFQRLKPSGIEFDIIFPLK
jgi:signal transduction histidine kinase